MDEDSTAEQAARQVFVSILSDAGPSKSPSTTTASASHAFTSRVLGKRITLANLDRERPTPKDGSIAQRQVRRRNTRLQKRQRRDANAQADKAGPSTKRRAQSDVVATENIAAPSRPLSRRQRKARGLEGIDEDVSYTMLQPVHSLWLAYIHRLLGLVDADGKSNYESSIRYVAHGGSEGETRAIVAANAQSALQGAIVKADFVGAPIRVIRAKNPALIGIEGLVAKETEGTFLVVQKPSQSYASTADNRKRTSCMKTVSKANAVFSIQVQLPTSNEHDVRHARSSTSSSPIPEALEFPLYGNQLCNTLPTRATKKFKARKTIDLG